MKGISIMMADKGYMMLIGDLRQLSIQSINLVNIREGNNQC